jgi:hypothetical protein
VRRSGLCDVVFRATMTGPSVNKYGNPGKASRNTKF